MQSQTINHQIYLELRRIQFSHWRRGLIDAVRRLKRHSLLVTLFLGPAVAALFAIYIPIIQLFSNTSLARDLFPIALVQSISWALFFLQRRAIRNNNSERYLRTLAVPERLKSRIELQLVLLSNHILWLTTLPAVVFLFFDLEFVDYVGGLLKFLALIFGSISLQMFYLKQQIFPWFRFFSFISLFVASDYFFVSGQIVLALVCFVALPYCTLARIGFSAQRPRRTFHQSPTLLSQILKMFSPWVSFYINYLFNRRSMPSWVRLTTAVAIIVLSLYFLFYIPNDNQFWLIFYATLGYVYCVTGLQYQLRERFLESRKLLASLPMGPNRMQSLDVQFLMLINIFLSSIFFAVSYQQHFIDVSQLLFLFGIVVVYTPTIYFILGKGDKNTLAWVLLSMIPSAVLAISLYWVS